MNISKGICCTKRCSIKNGKLHVFVPFYDRKKILFRK